MFNESDEKKKKKKIKMLILPQKLFSFTQDI